MKEYEFLIHSKIMLIKYCNTVIVWVQRKLLLAVYYVLSDCNGAQTHNHLIRKRTFNQFG